jgi:hypothetical protein
LTDREREARELALRACREQGCTCDVEIEVETIDGLDAPAVAVMHDDWCPAAQDDAGAAARPRALAGGARATGVS